MKVIVHPDPNTLALLVRIAQALEALVARDSQERLRASQKPSSSGPFLHEHVHAPDHDQ